MVPLMDRKSMVLKGSTFGTTVASFIDSQSISIQIQSKQTVPDKTYL